MSSFKNDYSFGTKNEDTVLIKIEKHFNDNIKKSSSSVSRYDFKGDTYYYELKTRNNKYNTYPTTLIPYNKIIEGKKQIFLFDFIDGLYYIEYNKDVFSNFELDEYVRNKRIDYNDKKSLYYFIPINKLILINI
jgi:hypothetical protein